MSYHIIPLDATPDQRFNVTVEAGGENIPLILRLRYNTEGEFWRMDVSDGRSGDMLLSNVPLLTGKYPAANLLRQFAHLSLGDAVILPVSDQTRGDIPGLDDLGTDFVLVWGGGAAK